MKDQNWPKFFKIFLKKKRSMRKLNKKFENL